MPQAVPEALDEDPGQVVGYGAVAAIVEMAVEAEVQIVAVGAVPLPQSREHREPG
jgi:hypothetical protein